MRERRCHDAPTLNETLLLVWYYVFGYFWNTQFISALSQHGVEGYQVEGRSGVWVRRPLSEDKVAAIGVRVEKGVTMHGFAVNCDNTLAGFRGIIPCGITDAGVTTVSEVVGAPVAPALARRERHGGRGAAERDEREEGGQLQRVPAAATSRTRHTTRTAAGTIGASSGG